MKRFLISVIISMFCATGLLADRWERIGPATSFGIVISGKVLQSGAVMEANSLNSAAAPLLVSIIKHRDGNFYKCHVGGKDDVLRCWTISMEY